MQVKARRNLIYDGKIYSRGESFECEEKFVSPMETRGLIESEAVELPILAEEIKRKKNSA